MFSPLYDAPGIPSPWRNQNIMSVCSDLQLLTLGTSLRQPLGDLILSLISTPGNSLTKNTFILYLSSREDYSSLLHLLVPTKVSFLTTTSFPFAFPSIPVCVHCLVLCLPVSICIISLSILNH